MSKATKIDADTWVYRGWTIVRCTHSRTYIVTAPERIPGSNYRLRDAKDSIDFLLYRRDKQSIAACERGEPIDCPDQHLCRHGIDN